MVLAHLPNLVAGIELDVPISTGHQVLKCQFECLSWVDFNRLQFFCRVVILVLCGG